MKTCKKCKESKSLEHFPIASKYKGKIYLKSYCKLCSNKKTYEWFKEKQGVYGIFSDNECLYVGESSWLRKRIDVHKTRIKNPYLCQRQEETEMYIRIAKHNNVVIKVLEETKNHKEKEHYYINKLNPKYNTYD